MNEWEVKWSKNHFDLLALNAIWGLPSSGLVFKKVSQDELTLDSVMPWNDDIGRAFQDGRDVPSSKEALFDHQRKMFTAVTLRFEAAGIKVTDPEGLLKVYPAEITAFQAAVNEPDMVTFCCLFLRPGFYGWIVELEYTKFKPTTILNDDFHMGIMTWPIDSGLKWGVIIFHQSELQFAESILWKHGLRKIRDGFAPAVIRPEGTPNVMGIGVVEEGAFGITERFPLKGDRVYFLENHLKGAPNVIYSNDPEKLKKAREHEEASIEHFFEEHAAWCETPEGKKAVEEYLKRNPSGYNK